MTVSAKPETALLRSRLGVQRCSLIGAATVRSCEIMPQTIFRLKCFHWFTLCKTGRKSIIHSFSGSGLVTLLREAQ